MLSSSWMQLLMGSVVRYSSQHKQGLCYCLSKRENSFDIQKSEEIMSNNQSMIIVSGRIYVRPGARDNFLALSTEAMVMARRTSGCRDFVVAADPLETDRVNVYEEWASREALTKFRGEGPDDDLSSSIVNADVSEYVLPHSDRPV